MTDHGTTRARERARRHGGRPPYRLAALTIALVAGACAHAARMEPRAAAEPLDHVVWSTTLNTARDMADGGRYGMADALLARYALANPDSPSAHESDFWRALILLDPDNPLTSSAARVLLERYLGYDDGMHRDEARVLLAVAASRDSMRALLAARDAALRAQATAPHPGDREAELLKENQALHDQLEKTQAELDRIKKRLVAPKP